MVVLYIKGESVDDYIEIINLQDILSIYRKWPYNDVYCVKTKHREFPLEIDSPTYKIILNNLTRNDSNVNICQINVQDLVK
jgi:hypothetical protein